MSWSSDQQSQSASSASKGQDGAGGTRKPLMIWDSVAQFVSDQCGRLELEIREGVAMFIVIGL